MTRRRAFLLGAALTAIAVGGAALAGLRIGSLEDDLSAARGSIRGLRTELEDAKDGWIADHARLRRMTDARSKVREDLYDRRLKAKELRRITRALMPNSGPCLDKYPLFADVDGDGATDLVYHEWIKRQGSIGRAVLGVCTDAGRTDKMSGAGQSELLLIIDIDSDGKDEIFFGGTTCCGQLAEIATITEAGLKRVRLENGKPLHVVQGMEGQGGGAFGCVDEDGDGRPELIQVSVRSRGENFRWTRTAYKVESASATQVSSESGTTKNDPEKPDVNEVSAVAGAQTEPCKVKAGG